MKIFQVGGCVRDELLGVPSKDIDFSVVLESKDFDDPYRTVNPRDPYTIMVERLERDGFKVWRNKDGVPIGAEHLTARAQFPVADGGLDVKRVGGVFNPGKKRLTADFVLARKDGVYSDGRRPDTVEAGTLEDDILRRDFTMNALAKGEDGQIIDRVNGVQDINEGVIRAVGTAFDRLNEDALRALRALRFHVTLGFRLDRELEWAMQSAAVLDKVENVISDERINDELSKMFRFDTRAALFAMADFPLLTAAVFSGSVSLDATMKTKGRGR